MLPAQRDWFRRVKGTSSGSSLSTVIHQTEKSQSNLFGRSKRTELFLATNRTIMVAGTEAVSQPTIKYRNLHRTVSNRQIRLNLLQKHEEAEIPPSIRVDLHTHAISHGITFCNWVNNR